MWTIPLCGADNGIENGWGSESDIHGFVLLVFLEIVKMVGLKDVISCLKELSIFDVR